MIKAKKLKNGMRYHLVPFKGTEAATVLVLTKVGSRFEDLKVWGGSHFIEHLMFKGTKKRPKTIDISKTLDRYGARYNAYTGKEVTGYYVKMRGDKMPVAIDLLHDMIFHSLYKEEEMKKERQVIVEEIKMYEENPIMHLGDLLEQAMYDGNPLGREIAGTAESVLTMDRDDLIAYRDAYYTPSKMVVVIAGNVPKDAEELLEKSFGQVKKGEEPPSYLPFGIMPDRETPRLKRQHKPVEQIQLGIGFPTVGEKHEDIPAIKLLANILGGTMSSRLFIEVREKHGLCYSVRASADAYDDVGSFSIKAGLDAKRLKLAMETIMKELKKMKDHGVTEEELAYAKDNVEGGMKLSLENSSNQAEYFGHQELVFGGVHSTEDELEAFKKVTKKDIARVAQDILQQGRMSLAVIGPYKTDKDFLKNLPDIVL
jgi:predicted Zn-dependent peptidase